MADTIVCSACGAENEPERKYCGECGTALARACTSCGTANPATVNFCGECGRALAAPAEASPIRVAGQAERRLVSILFADLVGYTALSESRDFEEVRELQTRYFDTARTEIERYGGKVEKYIGDAVMAVWGAPQAREDDAERAVRAGLEFVDAVRILGAELGAAGLQARAGVLTGEAAVTLDAENQGIVAGDLVNTAARIQAVAEPGTVLVGEATHRAAEAAIAFEDAGAHRLKGKNEPLRLWRALRVIGLVGGMARSTALEPPFVGRDRELRLVKDLFHASSEDNRGHLVSVVGSGGIGKSRLAWEFEKYIDGLAEDIRWHSGRCLAYGDGVAFWALAEMIRGRSGIVEDEEAASARAKLRAAIEEHVNDAQERRFVEPRLAHLLGLEESTPGDQENLFASARLFFERLAQERATVLVFEDIHWADSALLDFIEYLIEWSRDVPIFVLTLARAELVDRRPTWGSGRRNFTSIFLDPLAAEAMEALLTGPVPGLPEDVRERILERAEGVPFYAVETVRMLLDRGVLVRDGATYRMTREIGTLEVPETLQALISARLDGLSGDERRIVQQVAVLGRTFWPRGIAALSGLSEDELEPLLGSLVRKEIFALTVDPLSAERGQYAFLQDLVKKVAYDTLSRRQRKALHLAAAEHLRTLGEDDEIVEVLAAHYLDAYEAAPGDPDADRIRDIARNTLALAGERAASLAAHAEAQRLFERAAALTDDSLREAELYERAGTEAWARAAGESASTHFERAIELFETSGEAHPAARVAARQAEILWERGRLEEGLERMDRAFGVLSQHSPDADLATLAAQLGRFLFFAGRHELSAERLEAALDTAEAQLVPEVLSQALNTKALILYVRGRKMEAHVLLRHALTVALEHDKPSAALRAYYNLMDFGSQMDAYDESAAAQRDGLALARRTGNRYWEENLLAFMYPHYALGRWETVLEAARRLPRADWREARQAYGASLNCFVPVNVHTGRVDEAESTVAFLGELRMSADRQERSYYGSGAARVRLACGDPAGALELAAGALKASDDLGFAHDAVKEAFVTSVEAALELGDVQKADDLLSAVEGLSAGMQTAFLRAHSARFRARLASLGGDDAEAERGFKQSVGLFREIGFPFYLGVTLLEQAEWTGGTARPQDAAVSFTEAREIFERLGAVPWLERAATAAAPAQAHA